MLFPARKLKSKIFTALKINDSHRRKAFTLSAEQQPSVTISHSCIIFLVQVQLPLCASRQTFSSTLNLTWVRHYSSPDKQAPPLTNAAWLRYTSKS